MNTTNVTPEPLSSASAEDKTTAILSYLTLIGFIVAVVIHSTKKTALGAYHLRQSLGLMLLAIACMIALPLFAAIPILGWFTGMVVWLGLLILWVMGLLSAIQGDRKPLPVLGVQFQTWFGKAFE